MASEHLIDPAVKPWLDSSPPLHLTRESLPVLRAAAAEALRASGPVALPPGVSAIEFAVPRADRSAIRVVQFRPDELTGECPALLHIPGGGYIFSTLDRFADVTARLASSLGCAIFSVDYRLAPETPHPGPLEDCYAALKWLTTRARDLRVSVERLGVKGESAGGGLAAALALLVRDRGELKLSFQHLIYPMIDDRTAVRQNPHPFTGEFIWTAENNRFGWTSLLGDVPGGPNVSSYAAAARAEDLEGLPPTYLSVGALDLFLEENLEYVRRLSRAGVAVEMHVYPGAFHGFEMVPTAPVAIASKRDSVAALRRAIHQSDPSAL